MVYIQLDNLPNNYEKAIIFTMKNTFRSRTSFKNSLNSWSSATRAMSANCVIDLRLLTVVDLPAGSVEGSEVELT